MHYADFQAGWLVLKSSAGERAWFLNEESETRNKLILLAGKNQRAEELASLMKVTSNVCIKIKVITCIKVIIMFLTGKILKKVLIMINLQRDAYIFYE
jgi:hypothetical protein